MIGAATGSGNIKRHDRKCIDMFTNDGRVKFGCFAATTIPIFRRWRVLTVRVHRSLNIGCAVIIFGTSIIMITIIVLRIVTVIIVMVMIFIIGIGIGITAGL